jgi:hypothetical protein
MMAKIYLLPRRGTGAYLYILHMVSQELIPSFMAWHGRHFGD